MTLDGTIPDLHQILELDLKELELISVHFQSMSQVKAPNQTIVKLNFSNDNWVRATEKILYFIESCPMVETLNFEGNYAISEAESKLIASKLPKLNSFCFREKTPRVVLVRLLN